MENKYDFPPPVDNKLFFGCCVLVCQVRDEVNLKSLTNLSLDLWNKIYDKLFGGFENLTLTKCDDDDCDDDELAVIPKSKKTKNSNYLKDGFVVDDDASDEDGDESGSSSESDDESGNINDIKVPMTNTGDSFLGAQNVDRIAPLVSDIASTYYGNVMASPDYNTYGFSKGGLKGRYSPNPVTEKFRYYY